MGEGTDSSSTVEESTTPQSAVLSLSTTPCSWWAMALILAPAETTGFSKTGKILFWKRRIL